MAVANDDCPKSREKVKAYFEVNAPAFIEAINKAGDDAERAGKDPNEAVHELTKFTKSMEKKMDDLKCGKDDAWQETFK